MRWDPLRDDGWCRPCKRGRHQDCQAVPFCHCWACLPHDDEEDPVSLSCALGRHTACAVRLPTGYCACSCHEVRAA